MTQKVLIHIGYHKTATTWLQRHFLDRAEASFHRDLSKENIYHHIVAPRDLSFSATELRRYYEELLALRPSVDDVSVISSERLSGHPHSGAYDSVSIANRLQATWPEARILIVVREQVSAILSCYLQYVKFGGICSLYDYMNMPRHGRSIVPWFHLDSFDYSLLVAYYRQLFGAEKVLVMPYEFFKAEPQNFCNKISEFMEVPPLEDLPYTTLSNKRLSALASQVVRHINKLLVKSTFNPTAVDLGGFQKHIIKPLLLIDRLLPAQLSSMTGFENFISKAVGERYREPNRRLNEFSSVDLGDYGYLL